MKNMQRYICLFFVAVLAIGNFSCKKDPQVNMDRIRIHENEKQFSTDGGTISMSLSGSVSYSKTISKMTLWLGTAQDLSDAVAYEVYVQDTTFSVDVDNLKSDTAYYYRYGVYRYSVEFDKEMEIGGMQTNMVSTHNLCYVPSVETGEVSHISQTSAVVAGMVVNDGGAAIVERGVCWSTNSIPTILDNSIHTESGDDSFSVSITGLSAETTYYVRAYAINEVGVGYGVEKSFMTLSQLQDFTVSVSANPSNGGTVTGGGIYQQGQSCTVAAAANNGYTFTNWTENGNQVSSNASYTFTVTGNRTLVANFTANTQSYIINVSANPSNGGSVSGDGIYQQGHTCTVHATANSGYTFVNWTENGNQVSSNANYTFTVTGTRTLVANFAQYYTISVSANPSNGGTVSGSGTFQQGQVCSVTAEANDGYIFDNWTENGDQVSSSAHYSFSLNSDRSLVANFILDPNPGVINAIFSVSSTKQVYFSRGNLQYNASLDIWRFADKQYDYIGSSNSNISQIYDGWIDLFGWGTSGWNSGANCYQPWSTGTNYDDYFVGGSSANNLTGAWAKADWGVFNAISNGGNISNTWRTLTKAEWEYLFNTRVTISGIRFAKALVHGVNGVIILPDDWSGNTNIFGSYNSGNAPFTYNTISDSQWNTLEQAGAVFLPASGQRNGTSVSHNGSYGYYWSVSANSSLAYCIYFYSGTLNSSYSINRYYGQSVRLVRPAN